MTTSSVSDCVYVLSSCNDARENCCLLFSIPCLFFFTVSPCSRLLGGGEKLQPIVEYKPQRSYNRSAIGITRMFLNVTEKLTHM